MPGEILCPLCSQADQVEKVSTIYLVGIGLRRQVSDLEQGQRTLDFKLTDLSEAELRRLAHQLKPPASTKRVSARPLHPDMVVLTFSLLAPIFLFGILTSQRPYLGPVILALIVLYGLYFWKRKELIARFEKRVAAERKDVQRVQAGIERWMKLYYCARDNSVFLPGSDRGVPLNQFDNYLVES